MSVLLTCGARSTVNIDRSMVNTCRVQTGPWWAQVRPNTWRAVAQPRHSHGLLLGFVRSMAHTVWLTVDQCSWSMVLRQGPWWTEPIIISTWLGSCAPGAGLRCSPCPFLLCFFLGALPPATCSPASSRNGSRIHLRWGKASLCHGDCNGGVRATDGAS